MVTFIELKCVCVWVEHVFPLSAFIQLAALFLFSISVLDTITHFNISNWELIHTVWCCVRYIRMCVWVSARAVNAFLLNGKFYRVESKHAEWERERETFWIVFAMARKTLWFLYRSDNNLKLFANDATKAAFELMKLLGKSIQLN